MGGLLTAAFGVSGSVQHSSCAHVRTSQDVALCNPYLEHIYNRFQVSEVALFFAFTQRVAEKAVPSFSQLK